HDLPRPCPTPADGRPPAALPSVLRDRMSRTVLGPPGWAEDISRQDRSRSSPAAVATWNGAPEANEPRGRYRYRNRRRRPSLPGSGTPLVPAGHRVLSI